MARWVITPYKSVGSTKIPSEYVEVRSNALIPEAIDGDDAWAVCMDKGLSRPPPWRTCDALSHVMAGKTTVMLFPRPSIRGMLRQEHEQFKKEWLQWEPRGLISSCTPCSILV